MRLEEKLGRNVFKVDKESHIRITHEICRVKCAPKYCIFVCPAKVYSLSQNGDVLSDPDGCLECGTCVIACVEEALSWHYPRPGFGVQYRFS